MKKENSNEEEDKNQESKEETEGDADQEQIDNDVDYDELSTNEKFRYLGFELIDIGLFQGQKGIGYI